ncbi:MAG: DUF4097 family beta strand repeat protein [Cyclobacteriaceae bacterium]|nr:DUF4097 family beta strand repeat protein [Cyclobacteriaceae bacterium]
MKKLIAIGIFISMATVLAAQDSGEFAVPLSDPAKRGKLKAELKFGSITIRGTARKDVLVKYAAQGGNEKSKKPAPDGLTRVGGGTLDLEVSENGNNVKVESGSWNTRLNLVIEVPSGFDLKVSTYNSGDILIENIQGELEIESYNGKIDASQVSGSMVASTYNGPITVTFDKVKEGAPMSYSTYNGNVDLTFPATTKASFKMKTERGEILSGFDMKMITTNPVRKEDTKTGTYKVVVDKWVQGEVNGGGAEISMRNYNGNIIIRKK